MNIWDIICILLIGGILVYMAFKEGLKQGAEHAINEMENEGLIEIDTVTGDIKPVHWEYVYPDRDDNVNTPEDQ
jgi:hypothetical protein